MKASLHLTHNCNLNCGYCYTGNKIERSMPIDVGKGAIEFVMGQSSHAAEFTFFGGEPLLEFDLIENLTKYAIKNAKKRRIEARFNLITNGTLLNAKILKFLMVNNIDLRLSIDGNQYAQDCSRRFSSGISSYKVLEKVFGEVLYFKPDVLLLMVITPLNAGYLAQSIEELYDKGFRNFVPSPNFEEEWQTGDLNILSSQYEKISNFYIDRLREGHGINISFMDGKIYMQITSDSVCGHQCEIARGEIAIACSGNIYPCLRMVSEDNNKDICIGNISEGFNEIKRNEYLFAPKDQIKGCEKCVLVKRCLNHCGALNYVLTGNIKTASGIVCKHEQMIIPIVDKAANILFQESNEMFLKKFYSKSKNNICIGGI